MPNWFFSSKENQEKLEVEVNEWVGTPFRHFAGVKKVGADCLHFALAVYESLGAIKDPLRGVKYYGHDWCHHTDEQKFYKGLTRRPEFVEVGFKNLMNGDLLLYQFGRAASHCGIYYANNIYQSINLVGVHRVYYKDGLWAKRVRYNFRIKYV